MPTIKFTVSEEAVAYLRWLARNVLFEKGENDAARHLMMKQIEDMRRTYRSEEPAAADLVPAADVAEAGD